MNVVDTPVYREEVLSIADLMRVIWRRKFLVASLTLLCAAVSLAASLIIPKRYEASIVFLAVSEDSTGGRLGGLSSLVSQFGGLASIAGLSTSANEHKAESLAILQSEALTEEFIRTNDLLPVLFEKKWDSAAAKWKTSDPDKIPTLWKANDYFKKRVRTVSTDAKTGISTMTISWKDAKLAARWANDIVALANENIRKRTVDEAERNVEYLNEELRKSTVVAVQNSISSLLESEFKKIMLARGSSEYAFRVLDAAVPPEKAAFPNKVLFTILGAMAGFAIAVGIILAGPAPRSTD